MTINEIQKKVVEEFAIFDDWMDRYNYLIDLGNDLEGLTEDLKKKDYLIEGCQSKVWLRPELKDGLIYFKAESDAIITKGIVALLVKVLSGRSPAEIMNADLFFIDEIGLKQNLSPTRSNGLLAMVKQMKLYAIAYNAKEGGN
ncbi:MAG: SufE family protein [Bacteroidales bacterium]|nr:SufE family protein [Bacteroidales bacterium]